MPIKDLKCEKCGKQEERMVKCTEEVKCDCGGNMSVDFSSWKTMNFRTPFSRSIYNATGTGMNSFGALHDPLVKSELGLSEGGKKYNLLPPEESTDFAERLVKDGDSPELRKDVIRRREEIKKAKVKK